MAKEPTQDQAFYREKLDDLLDDCCMDEEDFLEEYAHEVIVPGICMNNGCGMTYDYEPDQDRGWCERCKTNTVKSGLLLMWFI